MPDDTIHERFIFHLEEEGLAVERIMDAKAAS
jgi:hypothetical protein